ncbi:Two component regulator three Y domain protein, partial [Mesotoga sp. Brook.08.YT.4.2.5.1]
NDLNTSYTWSGYSEGAHVFEVRAQDSDGAYSNVISWNFTYNAASQETGGFKVANSWGIGGWENVPDGFLYITYEAMKQNKVLCFVVDPKDNYEPRAIAIFKISHLVRDDCSVYVGVGNPSSPSREKRFDDYYQRSGPHPYPDNKMVLDITELLPFNNETLYLKVYDTNTGSTGTIEFFSVEIYDNYPSGIPSSVFTSTQTPKNTVNNSYVNVQIPGVTVSAASNYDLSSNDGGLSKRLLEGMKETMGVYEEGRGYNEIINGYGTGLRPPSVEEWEEIANSWYEMEAFGLQETLPVSLDHSSSIHFPPIGNQGNEGSCVAFSVGYYTATFYEACDRNWDLSGAQWVGGYYGAPTASYQDRILSPDFIYHQINDGYDQGSAYQDAMKLISNTGVSSWKEMPYNPNDSKTWPSESAWREAPRYRSRTNVMRVLMVENDQDIQTLKSYINAGYLVSISVDADKYANLSPSDVWNSTNYTNPNTNHANTIVGYDDHL